MSTQQPYNGVNDNKKIVLIAEIGCNHEGNYGNAIKMAKAAIEAGADYAKFQSRNIKALYTQEALDKPHPNPEHSFGNTYGEHRAYLELEAPTLNEIWRAVPRTSTSVWDIETFRTLTDMHAYKGLENFIKIPSAAVIDTILVQKVLFYKTLESPVILSFGLLSYNWTKHLLDLYCKFNSSHFQKPLVLMYCDSNYPVETLYVEEMYRFYALFRRFQDNYEPCFPIYLGYSGHERPENVTFCLIAKQAGATWFERHFTTNQIGRHTDQACSMTPENLRYLRNCLNEIDQFVLTTPHLCQISYEYVSDEARDARLADSQKKLAKTWVAQEDSYRNWAEAGREYVLIKQQITMNANQHALWISQNLRILGDGCARVAITKPMKKGEQLSEENVYRATRDQEYNQKV